MPGVTARGSVGINSMGGFEGDSTGVFDMTTPSGWFHTLWIASVVIIIVMLWML